MCSWEFERYALKFLSTNWEMHAFYSEGGFLELLAVRARKRFFENPRQGPVWIWGRSFRVLKLPYSRESVLSLLTSWHPWKHGFHGIYPFIKTQDRDLGWACFICWSGSGYADSISWCSVIACPDWVHMFRGCARLREAIEDHQGIPHFYCKSGCNPTLNLHSLLLSFYCQGKWPHIPAI